MLYFVLSITLASYSVLSMAKTAPAAPPAPPQTAIANVGIGQFAIDAGEINMKAMREQFKAHLAAQEAENQKKGWGFSAPWQDFDTIKDESTWRAMSLYRPEWRYTNAEYVTWVYQAPRFGSKWPSKALRITDNSNANGYNVHVTHFCADSTAECADFLALSKATLAPKPDASAPALAMQQWFERIATEVCRARPISMSQPRYPTLALRDGIGGTVMIGLRFNPCGNVRDAWIQASSGNRDLDRAAFSEVLKWQIDPTLIAESKTKGLTVVPITFRPE